jgi:hypothetical protein
MRAKQPALLLDPAPGQASSAGAPEMDENFTPVVFVFDLQGSLLSHLPLWSKIN